MKTFLLAGFAILSALVTSSASQAAQFCGTVSTLSTGMTTPAPIDYNNLGNNDSETRPIVNVVLMNGRTAQTLSFEESSEARKIALATAAFVAKAKVCYDDVTYSLTISQ